MNLSLLMKAPAGCELQPRRHRASGSNSHEQQALLSGPASVLHIWRHSPNNKWVFNSAAAHDQHWKKRRHQHLHAEWEMLLKTKCKGEKTLRVGKEGDRLKVARAGGCALRLDECRLLTFGIGEQNEKDLAPNHGKTICDKYNPQHEPTSHEKWMTEMCMESKKSMTRG